MKYNLAGLVCQIRVAGNKFEWLVFVRVFTDRYSAISIEHCNRWTEKFLVSENEYGSLQEIADYLGVDGEDILIFPAAKIGIKPLD